MQAFVSKLEEINTCIAYTAASTVNGGAEVEPGAE